MQVSVWAGGRHNPLRAQYLDDQFQALVQHLRLSQERMRKEKVGLF